MFHRTVTRAGIVFVYAGIIVLGFVAHQLFGTGLAYDASQDGLEAAFDDLLATTAPVPHPAPPAEPAPDDPAAAPPVPAAPLVVADDGAFARIEVPAIGIDHIVVDDVTAGHLRRGPGHYPSTGLPGGPGTVGIAGHRTTYGAPFGRLGELAAGDTITVTTTQGRFDYQVTGTRIVAPSDTSVLADAGRPQLVLTTCHPRFSARQRLIVFADLTGSPQPAPPVPPAVAPADPARPAPAPLPEPTSTVATPQTPSDPVPAVVWALIVTVVLTGAWLLRRDRRTVAFAVLHVPAAAAAWQLWAALGDLVPTSL